MENVVMLIIGAELGVLFCLGVGIFRLVFETSKWRRRRLAVEALITRQERESAAFDALMRNNTKEEGQ